MVAFPLSVVIAFTNSSGTDGQSGLEGHIIDTVSPAHVTFNLFDYWFTEQSAPTNDRGNGNWGNQMGINAGHPFIFWSPDSSNGVWNLWTGDWNHTFARPGYVNDDNVKYGEYKGIVEDVLGEDGYPVLNLGDRSGNSFITNNGLGGTLNESLAYLFDPDASNDYKASYENVQGLVKYNGKGGYIYNSHENFAEFKQQSNFVGVDGNERAGYFDV